MKELSPMKYERIVSRPNEPIYRKKSFALSVFTVGDNVTFSLVLVSLLIFLHNKKKIRKQVSHEPIIEHHLLKKIEYFVPI